MTTTTPESTTVSPTPAAEAADKPKRKRRRDPKNVAIEAVGVAGVAALRERGLIIVDAELIRQLAASVQ